MLLKLLNREGHQNLKNLSQIGLISGKSESQVNSITQKRKLNMQKIVIGY